MHGASRRCRRPGGPDLAAPPQPATSAPGTTCRAEQKAAQELKVLKKAGLSSSLAEDEDESIRQSYRCGS